MVEKFDYSGNGITIRIEYTKKDFWAIYDSDYGPLEICGKHIMAMCPMEYTEEMLRERCPGITEKAKKLIDFLNEHPDFIETEKQNIKNQVEETKKELKTQRLRKSEMKKKFKSGEVSEKEYCQEIRKIEEIKSKISDTKYSYVCKLEKKYNVDLSAIMGLLFH